jgi:ArsR family transcriptional regulator
MRAQRRVERGAPGATTPAQFDKFFNRSKQGIQKASGGSRAVTEPLYKVKAEFFKTLGHPARIRILELLVTGDKTVAELLPEVGLESSNLSQQLGVLRRAGVVDAQRDGNTMNYSIASSDIAELLGVARKVLTGVLSDRVAVLEGLRGGTV